MSIFTKSILAASVLGAITMTVPAQAENEILVLNSKGERTMEVSYLDLDLSHANGMATLERRIAKASQQVCGDSFGHSSIGEMNGIRRCMKQARETALAAIESRANATQLARAQTPKTRR